MFPWYLIFLKRSLVSPILLSSSISLHWSLMKAFLSLLAILWNSAFRWAYYSFSLQPVLLIRTIPQASYPHPSVGRKNEKHNHRKLTKLITWPQPCLTHWNYESYLVGPPKMDRSWRRVLIKHGPLEKGVANNFSILAMRTSWTVWKVKKIWLGEMNSPCQ